MRPAFDHISTARGRVSVSPSAGGGSRGATVNDVNPTVLAWLGLPLAEDMDGRVAGFLEPPRSSVTKRVASYDGLPIERLRDAATAGEAPLREELRALGYVE